MEAVVAELSANSVVGLSSPRRMKVRGEIGGIGVVVLFDSGATNNIISKRVVKSLRLKACETARYGVIVAGGVKVPCKRVIKM